MAVVLSSRATMEISDFGVLNYKGTIKGIEVDLNGTIQVYSDTKLDRRHN